MLKKDINRDGELYQRLKKAYSISQQAPLFYEDPPIKNVPFSNRILICGDKFDAYWNLPSVIKRLRVPNSNLKIENVGKKLLDTTSSIADLERFNGLLELIKTVDYKINYVYNIGRFWDRFFDSENYLLNDSISKPRMIVAGRYMRRYDDMHPWTIDVSDRLEDISSINEVQIDIFNFVKDIVKF